MRFVRARRFALGALLLLPLLFAQVREDAHTTGCLPAQGVQACVACHPKDAASLLSSHPYQFCSPYCLTCHTRDQMAHHHNVGTPLKRTPGVALPLTHDNRTACTTCHLLSQPRYDAVRWKAGSLYDRMFRSESRYKTYFLAIRNDQGQLCLSCH